MLYVTIKAISLLPIPALSYPKAGALSPDVLVS